jgi:hypothetical protein
MQRNYKIPAVLCIILAWLTAGQTVKAAGSDSCDYNHQTYIAAGLRYLSDNVYLGRKDSLHLPYLTPLLTYHHRSGVFASAAVSYVPVPGRDRVDLVTLEAGYDHDFGKNISAGAYADYFSYSNETNNIKSGQNFSMGAYAGYTDDIVEPQIGVDVNLGEQTDYVVSLLLDHNFSLLQDRLTITPAAGVFAGTQRYYDTYLKKVNPAKKKSKTETATSATSDFKIVDYECSLPVKYEYRQWLLLATPTYAIPVHPATSAENGKTVKEDLSDSFFITLEADFRLKLPHHSHPHTT